MSLLLTSLFKLYMTPGPLKHAHQISFRYNEQEIFLISNIFAFREIKVFIFWKWGWIVVVFVRKKFFGSIFLVWHAISNLLMRKISNSISFTLVLPCYLVVLTLRVWKVYILLILILLFTDKVSLRNMFGIYSVYFFPVELMFCILTI